MSYWDVAEMASDFDLTQRCAACAAEENIPDAAAWARDHQLQLCASPGWDDAWASARAANAELEWPDGTFPQPGRDPGVITDEMILSATQAVGSRGGA